MWPAELLTDAEVRALTLFALPSKQKEWLRQAGIPFIDMPGRGPIVRRDDVRPASVVASINEEAFRPRRRRAA
jgi:hypothetical protein